MEPTVHHAESAAALIPGGDRIIRREFLPPYANPPISNYRKFWSTSAAAFWTAFGVRPGDGSFVNQLGTNPVTSPQRAFQEVGFGYTFKAALTTDYWFDVEIDAGPVSPKGTTCTIELQLLGSNAAPVVIPLPGRYLRTTATLAAYLSANTQYTLLFKGKVDIAVSPGQTRYGEVIARFPRLVVSYIRPWGIEPTAMSAMSAAAMPDETIDMKHALKAVKGDGKGGEVILEGVSYKEIAQAGFAGFGGFNDGK